MSIFEKHRVNAQLNAVVLHCCRDDMVRRDSNLRAALVERLMQQHQSTRVTKEPAAKKTEDGNVAPARTVTRPYTEAERSLITSMTNDLNDISAECMNRLEQEFDKRIKDGVNGFTIKRIQSSLRRKIFDMRSARAKAQSQKRPAEVDIDDARSYGISQDMENFYTDSMPPSEQTMPPISRAAKKARKTAVTVDEEEDEDDANMENTSINNSPYKEDVDTSDFR